MAQSDLLRLTDQLDAIESGRLEAQNEIIESERDAVKRKKGR